MNSQMKNHWDSIYKRCEVNEVGWYEKLPSSCLALISKCNIKANDHFLCVGAGASTLIDCLLSKGLTNITAVDISRTALDRLRERLGAKASLVKFVEDDITNPSNSGSLKGVAVWHDRALLHFFTEEEDRLGYLATLKHAVRKGGYVVISTFSLSGAEKCAGLSVKRYDQRMLVEFLGSEFRLIEYFDYIYHMPSGDPRPYICTLFQRMEIQR